MLAHECLQCSCEGTGENSLKRGPGPCPPSLRVWCEQSWLAPRSWNGRSVAVVSVKKRATHTFEAQIWNAERTENEPQTMPTCPVVFLKPKRSLLNVSTSIGYFILSLSRQAGAAEACNRLQPGTVIIPHTFNRRAIKYQIVVRWKPSRFVFSSAIKQVCVCVTVRKAAT